MLRTRWCSIAAGALALTAAAGPAYADDASSARAQALFDEGRKAMQEQRAAEACPKFAESQRLSPAVGTLLNLAVCSEKIGKTATAWGAYMEAATLAAHSAQHERGAFARERADALKGRLAKLAIVVPPSSEVPDLVVRDDGHVIGRGEWGSALPSDPGVHRIEATAPGRRTWTSTVDVVAAQSMTITVPALERTPEPASEKTSEPSATRANDSRRLWRLAAVFTGGLGLGAVAGGTVFGLRANSLSDDVTTRATRNEPWSADAKAEYESGADAATLANVFFISAGVALVAAGVFTILGWTGPDPSEGRSASSKRGVGWQF